jgi:hypothetical protein
MSEVVAFHPVDYTKPLTRQYPELGRAKEFKSLTKLEQLFVWRYACKSSELVRDPKLKADNKARAKRAFEWTYSEVTYTPNDHENYCNLNFPEHIKVACEWIAKRNPDMRSRALQAAHNQFNVMLEMMNEEVPETEDEIDDDGVLVKKPITPLAKKQHIEARQKAREEMTSLLAVIEEGYSVVVLDDGVGSDEYTIANWIREQRQNRT